MRSKQQPRPSYRWINRAVDNGGTGEEPESPGNNLEIGSSGSTSPSSPSSPVSPNAPNLPPLHVNETLSSVVEPQSPVRSPPSPSPHHDQHQHMITDHNDDIEHSIPATLIQDPNAERDLSPRCVSRDSSVGGARCPSRESVYSNRGGVSSGNAISPVAITLPATLPPHTAAMAAYLAAAAQQNHHRLMMTSPLGHGSVSPLVSSSSSPPVLPMLAARIGSPPRPQQSPVGMDTAILDFSTKRPMKVDPEDVVNLSKPASENSPLDLSVSNRKRGPEEPISHHSARKSSRTEYKPVVSPWTSPVTSQLPYFAAVAAASLSPKNNSAAEWNGKPKAGPAPNDATKALEKMSELSRLGGDDLFRAGAVPPGRHSAWQSHWLNKGAEHSKDVLKCVWCKQSFPSLAAMTTHMKEAKHCGVNVPVPPAQTSSLPPPQPQPPISSPSTQSNSSSSGKPTQADLNLLIKETMPLPRKLVRGQDVWLGKGAEQTRQILKCMWCGQSFRSLAEMTSHMQQTQHYTNIISQEQIISWKSSDDGKGGSGNPGSGGVPPSPGTGASSHVSAVLTCKVCDQAFSSLKELSNHMVKNSHYKEHIMRSITESGGRRRQTREKRKKSLPVRKLLELERAQHEFKNGDGNLMASSKPIRDSSVGRITCEKCGDKIETSLFVDHIRQCVGGGPISTSQRNLLKNALMSNNIIPPDAMSQLTASHRDGRKSIHEEMSSPVSRQHRSPSSATDLSSPASKDGSGAPEKSSSPSVLNAIEQLIEKSFDSRARHAGNFPGVPPSNAPMGSSILKRLGIDESVDYTKPLVDVQTMNLLRSYHHQQQNAHGYSRRERSGSESSSFSERGSSRVDSLTPDRKMDPPAFHMTPRTTPTTPDKRVATPLSEKNNVHEESTDEEMHIKKEIMDEQDEGGMNLSSKPDIVIKKEFEDCDDDRQEDVSNEEAANLVKRRPSEELSPIRSNRGTPTPGVSTPPSPISEQSPRSTPGGEKKAGGSLGALSSMFDSLSGGGSMTGQSDSNQKRGSSHPLAALQKLCDKTENHHNNRPSQQSTSSVPTPSTSSATSTSSGTTPGSILAFSWACNDAVMTSDSIMKCAFCDTPFISKGAYRHHLSKMHFVKDGVIPDPVAVKAPQQVSVASTSPSSAKGGPNNASGSGSQNKSPSPAGFEESPHSKFLKYTELAKQLSSKYV